MKQKIINGIVILIIVVVMAALIIPWPKDFKREFNGIRYQLGPENKDYSEQVKIIFDGEFYKSYFGLIKDSFTGSIYIDGVDVYRNEEFDLIFDENGTTVISHRCFIPEQRTMKVFNYGRLYLNENLDFLAIELFNDNSKAVYDKYDGYAIAAPAVNKAEAEKIMEDLVKD